MRTPGVFLTAAALIALLTIALAVPMRGTAALQATPFPPTPTDFFAAISLTPRPTGQPYVGAPQYPLAVLADGTVLPSLTGVGGKAERGPVAIRSGPGLNYPRIGRVAPDAWINIIGWNGWEADRGCTPDFASDLDMWVQVITYPGEVRGWSARCALSIVGEVTALPIVDAAGNRTFQR